MISYRQGEGGGIKEPYFVPFSACAKIAVQSLVCYHRRAGWASEIIL